jgi:DNA invertase Pin-like site-specific DNA recombinase
MNAAIYVRKSTEQLVADEQRSVTRQIEHAKDYAARKGWPINRRVSTQSRRNSGRCKGPRLLSI